VLAPILGICFALLAIPLPAFVQESFTLIGQGAGGNAAFVTGLILSSQPIFLSSNVVSSMLLKNVAPPLVAAGLTLLLPMRPDEARATILLIALPAEFLTRLKRRPRRAVVVANADDAIPGQSCVEKRRADRIELNAIVDAIAWAGRALLPIGKPHERVDRNM